MTVPMLVELAGVGVIAAGLGALSGLLMGLGLVVAAAAPASALVVTAVSWLAHRQRRYALLALLVLASLAGAAFIHM